MCQSSCILVQCAWRTINGDAGNESVEQKEIELTVFDYPAHDLISWVPVVLRVLVLRYFDKFLILLS